VSYTYNISKEDNRKAVVGTIIVHILLILLLIFYKITTLDPPFPTTEFVMELDFSGSEASGGAPSQPSQSTSQTASNAEDLATQDDESPVTVTKGKTTTTKTTTKTTTEETKTTTQDPKYTFGNVFGNGGSGSGEGDKDGDGKGSGDGLSGPGGTGKSGTGDGSGRDILYKPSPDNPIQETGVVIVRVWIDRNGYVVQAKELPSDPATTSTHIEHYREARAVAMKFKFSPSPSGYEKEYGFVTIRFTSTK
jgi:periplasmic protein TonB